MTRRRTPPEIEQRIIEAIRNGTSATAAGREHGVSERTARAIMQRHGLEVPQHSTSKFSKELIAELRRSLLETDEPYADIAARLGIGKSTVAHYAGRFNATKNRAVRDPQPRRISPEREATVVSLAVEGVSATRIAHRLGLATSTVLRVIGRRREEIETARDASFAAQIPDPVPAPMQELVDRLMQEGWDDAFCRSVEKLRAFVSENGRSIVPSPREREAA